MTRDESGPRSTAKDLNGAMVQATQRAVQSMGKRRILQLDPEDEHTREQRLKLFPDRAGNALAAITRLTNGTLRYSGPLPLFHNCENDPGANGNPFREREPFIHHQQWTWLTRLLRDQARRLITRDAELKAALRGPDAPETLSQLHIKGPRHALTHAVNLAMDEIVQGAALPGLEYTVFRNNQGTTINQTIRRHLIGEENWRAAVKALGNGPAGPAGVQPLRPEPRGLGAPSHG